MIVYGRNPVRECLRAGRRPVRRVWATAKAARELGLEGAALVERDEVQQHAGTPDHQGVCAEVGPYPYVALEALLDEPDPLIVILDEIQDPRNLGAIARSAEAAGVTGLVLHERGAADVTPVACKASAGAVEHLRIARVRNIADALADAKAAGCWIYGADAQGGPYLDQDYTGGAVLVLGAEGRGLRPRVRAACDALVAVPVRGRVDSLNVSAAAAVLLYGMLQSRLRA